jgi:type III secretion protein D
MTRPGVPHLPLEFRVLEGEQSGARTIVDAARPFVVSSSLSSDVVLRGAGPGEFELALRLRGDRTRLRIWVRRGEVVADGRLYRSGAQFDAVLYTPLRVGRCLIALGRPGNPAWSDLPVLDQAVAPDERLAAERPTERPAEQPAEGAAPALPPPPPGALGGRGNAAPPRTRWPRRLIVAGATLAGVSGAALVFAYAVSPAVPAPEQGVLRLQAALREAGLDRLSVRLDDGGRGVLVSGYLDSQAQRARLDQLLSREPWPSRVSVWTNDALAMAVKDVFRVHGVAAQGEVNGPGVVAVRTRVADLEALRRIHDAARRDVPGLIALQLENQAPAGTGPAARPLDDPGKRIASIVPGPTPYVVTADGTRYFTGALLPTGHRVLEIREREVRLEINGLSTPLRF